MLPICIAHSLYKAVTVKRLSGCRIQRRYGLFMQLMTAISSSKHRDTLE